jgi:hypothetical protein
MTAVTVRARTARSYLTEFGAVGGLMSATIVLFLLLAAVATLTVWPAGSILPGGLAELGTGGSSAGSAPAEAGPLRDAARRPVAGVDGSARAHDKTFLPQGDEGGRTGTRGDGGVTGVGAEPGDVAPGDEAPAPAGGSSSPDTGTSTNSSSGNGLKLGHSKPPNGNGKKVGHGATGSDGTAGVTDTPVAGPPGQSKPGKKPKG